MPRPNTARRQGATPRWAAIVPVAPLTKAKSRLRVGPLRARLALAFAQDTVDALRRSPRFGTIFVATSDPAVRSALAMPDVVFLDEHISGLNAVVEVSVSKVRAITGTVAVAVVVSDLPAATADQFTAAADRADEHTRSIVADGDRQGTTMLMLADANGFRPAYGVESRAAHLSAGCVELDTAELDGIRRDVDTVEHLHAAAELGLGEHTQRQFIDAALSGYP